MSEQPKLIEVIENIGKGFEDFKKVNDQRLDEEAAGNRARAKELSETLDKINDKLCDDTKQKEILEKRLAQTNDRLEILEALNDRPRASIKERMEGEHKELLNQPWHFLFVELRPFQFSREEAPESVQGPPDDESPCRTVPQA